MLRDVSFSMVYFPLFANLNKLGPRYRTVLHFVAKWTSVLTALYRLLPLYLLHEIDFCYYVYYLKFNFATGFFFFYVYYLKKIFPLRLLLEIGHYQLKMNFATGWCNN
jgi:hypothetical protein